eukprot:NODE_7056_length_420_cov_166.773585_g5432_i0.p3 GENE.NODE_7056_length_420_cov_166.773585_g5432_i0~~NODE_7056_length_420_cov_166.773585_g5432_i0.p3  ORF type:complete len:61 (+),score=9.91 NODE_7056_length_420_cov_166.773585_g5432_i0:154-336(+)
MERQHTVEHTDGGVCARMLCAVACLWVCVCVPARACMSVCLCVVGAGRGAADNSTRSRRK